MGATSQIAKDLIYSFSNEDSNKILYLYTRQPDTLKTWMHKKNINSKYLAINYGSFNERQYDAIINFVGVGDPKTAIDMGPLVFDITLEYDQMALDYLRTNPNCKYIFLSSGAVYGDVFNEPVNEESKASIAINSLRSWNWYSIAKLYAEARHRALKDLCIIDLRIFNYFSQSQNLNSHFLITDILRAIRDEKILKLSKENIVRDYLSSNDFFQLVNRMLQKNSLNIAIDCYTKAPIEKFYLLETMHSIFGLKYEFDETKVILNATGQKKNYYTNNLKAKQFGYEPQYSSLENIMNNTKLILLN